MIAQISLHGVIQPVCLLIRADGYPRGGLAYLGHGFKVTIDIFCGRAS